MMDPGSTGPVHWGLLSIDRSQSTHMWAGTNYGGATPSDCNTYKSQMAVLANCAWQKKNGWADRCFVYQNTVNALYDYETDRAVMNDTAKWALNWFAKINQNGSDPTLRAISNYSGLPWRRGSGGFGGRCGPCWRLNVSGPGLGQGRSWCGVPGLHGKDIKAVAPQKLDCESWSMNWNFTAAGMADYYVRTALELVERGGDGVDGLFMDEITGYPADGGPGEARMLNVSMDEQRAMQNASAHAIQQIIDGLVAKKKYLWHAFQHANDIGKNTNNNSNHVGGTAHDFATCDDWMAAHCNNKSTGFDGRRTLTVQFDPYNVNVSIASFLVVRPAYAWIGYGAGQLQPKWNDAFTWDVGVPQGQCKVLGGGIYERVWSYGTARMDCGTYSAVVPCNPADAKCGKTPNRPHPPPPSPPGPHPNPPPPTPGPRPPAPTPVPGAGWSASHNCTSCQGNGAKPLLPPKAGLSFGDCQALCVSNPSCRYMNYVLPASPLSQCSIWAQCDELCLTDHCWHWWVTHEYTARLSGVAWNKTACDSLPEAPPHSGLE